MLDGREGGNGRGEEGEGIDTEGDGLVGQEGGWGAGVGRDKHLGGGAVEAGDGDEEGGAGVRRAAAVSRGRRRRSSLRGRVGGATPPTPGDRTSGTARRGGHPRR